MIPLRARIRHLLLPAAKMMLIAGAMYFLVSSGRLEISKVAVSWKTWPAVAACLALVQFSVLLVALRLWLLARGNLRGGSLLQITLIHQASTFFSTFLFGSIGGDIVRYTYLNEHLPSRSSRIMCLLIDRLSGLGGLILLGSVTILVIAPEVSIRPEARLYLILVHLFSAGIVTGVLSFALLPALKITGKLLVVAAMAAIGLIGLRWASAMSSLSLFEQAGFLMLGVMVPALLSGLLAPRFILNERMREWYGRRLPFGERLSSLCGAVAFFQPRLGLMSLTLFISMFSHLLNIMAVYLLARAMGYDISISNNALASVIAMLTTIVPLPFGGVGVGEIAYDQIVRILTGGVLTEGASIFFCYRVWSTVVFLSGALVYLALGRKKTSQEQPVTRES